MTAIRERLLQFLGHFIRNDTIEKTMLTRKIDLKRQRGRHHNYSSGEEMDTGDLIRTADDRNERKSMMADVCIR